MDVTLLLLRNVENAAELRKALLAGTLGSNLALIKAEVILDPLQV